MAADLKAATAQSQKADAPDLAKLFDAAIGLWQEAVGLCQGRAKERAQRNLADNQKVRASIGELLGAGEQCAGSQKDANTLQDLARQATTERRWQDAAVLYRKSENMWDLAAERCTGPQQQLAAQRREQVAVDGHNAEFCAPRFDRARDFNQRFRNSQAAMQPAEKQTQSQMAETLWREAIGQCKGPALDLARSNAQNLARERGTAWVATQPPDLPATPLARAPAAPAAAGTAGTVAALGAAGTNAPGQAGAAAATGARAAAGGAAAVGSGAGTAATAAAAATTTAAAATGGIGNTSAPARAVDTTPKQVDLVLDGGTKLTGLFARAEDGLTYTGQGRILWRNGDAYDGAVRAGKRHGQGEFTWANGQKYKGDWVNDRPEGNGVLRFVNGNLYDGSVVDGQPHGKGKMIYASGDVYTGQLNQGVQHGQGAYLWTSGQRYDGPWVRGQAVGQALMTFANGNTYQGEVLEGQPHGQGKLSYVSGDVYTGTLAKGLPSGQGVYQWKSGDRYTGAWKAGLKDGQGVMAWSNGDRWEGVFANDQPTAQGQLIRKAP